MLELHKIYTKDKQYKTNLKLENKFFDILQQHVCIHKTIFFSFILTQQHGKITGESGVYLHWRFQHENKKWCKKQGWKVHILKLAGINYLTISKNKTKKIHKCEFIVCWIKK